MALHNALHGDTLEGVQIGDTIINLYGEFLKVVGERGSVWLTESKSGRVSPIFKYNPDRVIIGTTEV